MQTFPPQNDPASTMKDWETRGPVFTAPIQIACWAAYPGTRPFLAASAFAVNLR